MKLLKYIVTTMLLLMTLVVAGCGEDKWVGTWYDKTDNYISKSVITKEKNKDKRIRRSNKSFLRLVLDLLFLIMVYFRW